jgi:hypothetical protein
MRTRALADRRLVLVLVLAVLAAACGGTSSGEATTYKDPDYSLVEIPNDWQVYTTAELTGFSNFPFVVQPATGALPILSQLTFAGTPTRDTSSLLAPLSDSPYPVGSATVRAIDADLREQISRLTLAELVLAYHAQPHQEFIAEDVRVDDFEGIRRVVVYTDPNTAADAAAILVSLTDPDDARMYSIGVGCSVDCFNLYSEEINQVVDSWVVNTR